MRRLPRPELHPTREASDRAQAAEALGALDATKDNPDYNKITLWMQPIDRYVHARDAPVGRDDAECYRWVDGKDTYTTNFNGDQMLVASAAARALVRHAKHFLGLGKLPGTKDGANQAHALAKRAQMLAEAAQAALRQKLFAPRSLPPVVGRRAAVTATALDAAGVADLAVVAKQSRAIFSSQGTPAAPGTRLQALLRVATSTAVRSLAAARLADPWPECSQMGPRELAAQCGTALAYRSAIAAAMARAHDGDGAVGHQVYCLKQTSSLGDWLLSAQDRQMCQNAMDAAWMRNGLRLEPELPPPSCALGSAASVAVMPRSVAQRDAPAWAQLAIS